MMNILYWFNQMYTSFCSDHHVTMSHDSGRHQVYRYTVLSKNVLVGDESELYELATLAGVVVDPNVFKYVLLSVIIFAYVGLFSRWEHRTSTRQGHWQVLKALNYTYSISRPWIIALVILCLSPVFTRTCSQSLPCWSRSETQVVWSSYLHNSLCCC